MSTETVMDADPMDQAGITGLPTAPCSVVWSAGHPFVLEAGSGPARWVGVNDRGRPVALTARDLARRGWTYTRH